MLSLHYILGGKKSSGKPSSDFKALPTTSMHSLSNKAMRRTIFQTKMLLFLYFSEALEKQTIDLQNPFISLLFLITCLLIIKLWLQLS